MKNLDGTLFCMPRETESAREESFRTSKINSGTMKASRKYRSTLRRSIFREGRDLWLLRCRQHCKNLRYEKSLELFQNSEFENIIGLFGITRMMIEGKSEIKNVFNADVASSLWEQHVLLKGQAIKWTKARVYIDSDSVLCLVKMHGPEEAIKKWNDQVSTLKMCPTFSELQGLDGDSIDFEWKIFPGATASDILHKIQADLQGEHITPENFSDRMIFMTMFKMTLF